MSDHPDRPDNATSCASGPAADATSREAGPAEDGRRVRERALALGFDVVGVARATEPLTIDHERYLRFLDRGMHGEMSYLSENAAARRALDTPELLLGARSVVCVGKRYARAGDESDPPTARGIARYARGQDYHNHVRKKVRRLAAFVRTLAPGVLARPLCDIEPLLERAWAARSGLGFVGKNGLVITPGQGSYQLLGEVVTTLELVPDTPMAERCGSCTRCLDACPTGAFEAPFVLDPRRCVAYWTIEAQGAPPPDLAPAIAEHLFGCDECQSVCPFNRTAPPASERTAAFRPLSRWAEYDVADLTSLDEQAWAELSEGTPLKRARRGGLARNAVLQCASRWKAGPRDERDLEAIRRGLDHEDAEVREAARWALGWIAETSAPVAKV